MINHELLSPEILLTALTIGEGLLVLGLNFRQRKAIRERDGDKCNFPIPNHNCNGSEKIPLEKRRLHINHILPRKYLLDMGIQKPDDHPELLLTLCENSHIGDPSNGHHIDPIHPDIRDAKKNYGKDKKSIQKAIETQKDKQAERVVWWNDSNRLDQKQIVLAVRNTEKMDRKKGGRSKWWPF